MISIEIPVTHGEVIDQVLDSIVKQSYQNFEVILVVPSKKLYKKVRKYHTKVVIADVGLLKARYLAHEKATGDYELILDETRMLDKDCLKTLASIKDDMAIISEKEIGKGLWANLAHLDKQVISKYNYNKLDPVHGFLLPRYYKKSILNHSFSHLTKKLKVKHFNKIIYGDHQLIYYEAYNRSKSCKVIKKDLIYHFGDGTTLSIMKKYFRYGKTYKLISTTQYKSLINFYKKKRRVPSLADSLKLYVLYATRGVPFVCGYLSS